MSLPRGAVKDDSSGAVFISRSKRELMRWTDDELEQRRRWLAAWLDSLDFTRSRVRRAALRERAAIHTEQLRRHAAARAAQQPPSPRHR